MLDVLLLFPSELDATEVDILLKQRLVPELAKAKGVRPSPYSRVVEASFDSLADWMTVVDALNVMQPAGEGETFAGLAPVVVFFGVDERV